MSEFDEFGSIFLSVFPTSIIKRDFRLGSAAETRDKFATDFSYEVVGPLAEAAQEGRDTTIEVLVDFPWELLVKRELVDAQIRDPMSKDCRYPGKVLKETFLMNEREYRLLARQSFGQFADFALDLLASTPLKDATTTVDGFGASTTRLENPTLQ